MGHLKSLHKIKFVGRVCLESHKKMLKAKTKQKLEQNKTKQKTAMKPTRLTKAKEKILE